MEVLDVAADVVVLAAFAVAVKAVERHRDACDALLGSGELAQGLIRRALVAATSC